MKITGWSILEVDMDSNNRSFTVKRVLQKNQLHEPGLKPTFIFQVEGWAQVMSNEHGNFLVRFKGPRKDIISGDPILSVRAAVPKLKRVYNKSPLGRLVRKGLRQLFESGSIN